MTGDAHEDVRADERAAGLRPWQTTVWAGMRSGPWWRLLRRHRFAVAPARLPVAGAVTLLTVLNSGAALLQRGLYGRRIGATQLASDPVFILGHWRTGTTLLHELLALDRRHVAPTTLECFAPDHFLILRWCAPLLRFLLPRRRPMDRMSVGWQRPQEDEFALCLMGQPSPYETIAFPNHPPPEAPPPPEVPTEVPLDHRYLDLDGLEPHQLESWQRAYLRFLRTVTYRRPGRLILNGPAHTCRIPHLAAMFPEAKYVHLVRNPRTVIPSTMHLWRSLYERLGLQRPNFETLADRVFDTFLHLHERFEQHRSLIGEHNLVELRYEALIEDPLTEVRRLYEHLALGDFASVEPILKRHLESSGAYQANRYTISPRLARRIDAELGPYMRRYGYA